MIRFLFPYRSVMNIGDETFTVVAEYADGPNAHEPGNVQCGLVTIRINLTVHTFRRFGVVSSAVATVHYGYLV